MIIFQNVIKSFIGLMDQKSDFILILSVNEDRNIDLGRERLRGLGT